MRKIDSFNRVVNRMMIDFIGNRIVNIEPLLPLKSMLGLKGTRLGDAQTKRWVVRLG